MTVGQIRFLLLHDKSVNELFIRQFFVDLYNAYLKLLLNPFYIKNSPINSSYFDTEVNKLGKLHFKQFLKG